MMTTATTGARKISANGGAATDSRSAVPLRRSFRISGVFERMGTTAPTKTESDRRRLRAVSAPFFTFNRGGTTRRGKG